VRVPSTERPSRETALPGARHLFVPDTEQAPHGMSAGPVRSWPASPCSARLEERCGCPRSPLWI